VTPIRGTRRTSVREGDATAHLALQHDQLMTSAAFSASSRLFDLKSEATMFSKKDISATIRADGM
jgi:hypothetical protein